MAFRFQIGKRPLIRAAAALAVILTATGCNKLRLGYDYADWLVIYSVEDNFDLDKIQRNRFKDDVAAYFKWHRKMMLPAYAGFLTWAADSVKNGLKPSEIDSGYAQYQVLMRRTLEPVVAKGVSLLSSLTPEQIDDWAEKQKKKNQKLRKDFSGSPDDRLNHRYVKIIDELEDWTGSLSKDQKARIKALNQSLPWNGDLWLDTREKAQERLVGLLRRHAGQDEIRKFLEEFYLHPEKLRSQEYQGRYRDFEIRLRTMILAVHNLLTPEQKNHFVEQVEKLSAEFRTLSLQE